MILSTYCLFQYLLLFWSSKFILHSSFHDGSCVKSENLTAIWLWSAKDWIKKKMQTPKMKILTISRNQMVMNLIRKLGEFSSTLKVGSWPWAAYVGCAPNLWSVSSLKILVKTLPNISSYVIVFVLQNFSILLYKFLSLFTSTSRLQLSNNSNTFDKYFFINFIKISNRSLLIYN